MGSFGSVKQSCLRRCSAFRQQWSFYRRDVFIQVREYLLDDQWVFDAGDHFDGTAAGTARLNVDMEHALEPLSPGHGRASLVVRVAEVMQEHDGDGIDAGIPGPGEPLTYGRFVERLLFTAIGSDTARDLMNLLEEHPGFDDVAVEQLGPGLVADAQRVGEAPCW